MVKTPDRYPGRREENTILLRPGSPSLGEDGEFAYEDGVGFRFREEGSTVGLSGSGITEAQHEDLDSIVHALSETHYEEVTRTDGRVSAVTQWTNSGKTTKVRETVLQRSGGQVSQIDVIQYNASGTEVQRMTGTVTRTGGQVSSISWTETTS